MASRLGLLLLTTIILTLTFHHNFIIKTTPYLMSHIFQITHLTTKDLSDPIELEALEELTSLPLLGQLFVEDKVRALVINRQWNKVLSECKKCGEMRWVAY